MASRRMFIKGLSLIGMAANWSDFLIAARKLIYREDGVDWSQIRQLFPITKWDKIQLNSGSAGVMPTPVKDHLISLIEYVNSKAPYVAWSEWQETKMNTLTRLALLTGCEMDELQIVRNTTEALNMIIYGLQLRRDNEVIIASHDYPFARNAWLNRREREGISLKEVNITLPASDDEILKAYQSQITDKSKIIHITHITHREGHIMPVKKLTAMAHSAGIEVVVDGAHVVGQVALDLHDLNCDYFASSLHKWLNAPLGTGLLFVQREKIGTLYNHPSSNLDVISRMDKYEHIGTRSWSNEIGVSAALDFHNLIGQETKTARLQQLKEYWMNQVEQMDRVNFHTWIEPEFSAAVSTFSIDGLEAGQIRQILDQEYNIHAKSVGDKWGGGIRVSPNIFTSFEELDRLVHAINELSKRS